jgi:DNA-binding NtrC family response regulator
MHRFVPSISEEQLHFLEAYSWPGNIRELENYLERALILSSGTQLELPSLPNMNQSKARVERTDDVVRKWDEIARESLIRALNRCEGKIYGPEGAAQMLGMPPSTLQGKLRKYKIRYE